jgi:hypothetical protein
MFHDCIFFLSNTIFPDFSLNNPIKVKSGVNAYRKAPPLLKTRENGGIGG